MVGPIRNSRGELLDHTYHPGAPDVRDLVVIGHGVTANKDRPWAIALAEALSSAGVHALRFSFAGNGASEGRFGAATITKEVEDLGAVLDAVDGYRVGYAGHSMGGAVGVLRASEDTRITFLVSLAGMVHTRAFAERKFGHLVPGRDLMWDKPECPLSEAFLEDMARVDTVAARGAQIRTPWLLVHGTADEVVPLQDSLDILELAGSDPELVELPGVDHVFGGAENLMAERVVSWVEKTLARAREG